MTFVTFGRSLGENVDVMWRLPSTIHGGFETNWNPSSSRNKTPHYQLNHRRFFWFSFAYVFAYVYSLFRFLLTSAPFCCYSIFLSCLTFGERIQIQNIINFQVQNHLTKISHLKDLYTPWNSASLPLKIGPINAPKGNEKVFPSIHFLGANLLLVSEFVYTTPAPPPWNWSILTWKNGEFGVRKLHKSSGIPGRVTSTFLST